MNEDKPMTMEAPKPPKQSNLSPVTTVAATRGVDAPRLAGLCQANGWHPDKQVTGAEFDAALAEFETRPLGGIEEVTNA